MGFFLLAAAGSLTNCSRAGAGAWFNYPFLTRKERDIETGLDYFLARYYSSTQGRFTSVDPENAAADESDPQSWNGYAYARNSPALYTDPDGKTFQICYADGNCHEVSDKDFNKLKADATQLGSVFKDNKIYNEVDGQLVATASYTRTNFDDLNDFANGVIFGRGQTAGLVQRLPPVQRTVEIGAEIAATVISMGTTIGAVGGATLGLGATGTAAVAVSLPATITVGAKVLSASPKIIRQAGTRGWTAKLIKEAVELGQRFPAVNKIRGGTATATRFVHPTTGQSVVIDNITNEIIQVGGKGFLY